QEVRRGDRPQAPRDDAFAGGPCGYAGSSRCDRSARKICDRKALFDRRSETRAEDLNRGDTYAVFEPTRGSTPKYAGQSEMTNSASTTCPVAAATRTRPTTAGKLWRGRQKFHARCGQGHRQLRQLINQ